MRTLSGFMRHVSMPSTGIPTTFVVHQFYWFMDNNDQNNLSYQRIQQLIKKQLDRIEHETDAKTEEETQKHDHTECSIIAIIKRLWRMKRLRKKRRKS